MATDATEPVPLFRIFDHSRQARLLSTNWRIRVRGTVTSPQLLTRELMAAFAGQQETSHELPA